jgi:hypothetical protein
MENPTQVISKSKLQHKQAQIIGNKSDYISLKIPNHSKENEGTVLRKEGRLQRRASASCTIIQTAECIKSY